MVVLKRSQAPRFVGTGLVLLGLVSMSRVVLAEPVAESVAPTAGEMQIIVRDAATGELRGATPAEARTLHSTANASRAAVRPSTPLVRSHSSGAVGARLNDEFMHYSTMTRTADGRLVPQCVHSSEELAAALKTPGASPALAPTE